MYVLCFFLSLSLCATHKHHSSCTLQPYVEGLLERGVIHGVTVLFVTYTMTDNGGDSQAEDKFLGLAKEKKPFTWFLVNSSKKEFGRYRYFEKSPKAPQKEQFTWVDVTLDPVPLK